MKAKIPLLLQKAFPGFTWSVPVNEKVLFLSFDDGPIPQVTPWVLDQLKRYGARATFFCIGDNVQKHPEIYRRIASEGHSLGNHTFNHLNGWKTSPREYVLNTLKAQQTLVKYLPENNNLKTLLFRPPYGKIRPSQVKELRCRNYSIIMWDVLSQDYDRKLSPQKCYNNVLNHARPGSIIVLHDSLKAERNLKEVLPMILKEFSELGYSFQGL